jgi:hypothetical protein
MVQMGRSIDAVFGVLEAPLTVLLLAHAIAIVPFEPDVIQITWA